MANFSTIKGFNVQVLSADPPAPGVGQVWYNTTTGTMKGYGQIGTGAWAAGGSMPASYYGGAYSGTQAAGIYAGGVPGPTNTSYIYNGTSWTTSPATINPARHHTITAGCGTSTAAQLTGGETTPYSIVGNSEQFNGTSWSEVSALTTARYTLVVGGNQTAAIGMTGYSGSVQAIVEEWNGSSWTAGTAAPQAKYYASGGGTPTSALVCAGKPAPPSRYKTSDYWNGTSWTETSDMNTERSTAGTSTQDGTAVLVFGGEIPPRSGVTEVWDGSSWTEVADLATPANQNSGGGTDKVGISVGNENPNNGASEEWDVPTTTKTFSSS